MAVYYVNLSAASNGGGSSREDPYNALSALPTLGAGDIVELEPGSYQVMSGTYTVSGSGTTGNPITIRSNPLVAGPKPILRVSAEAGIGVVATSRSHIVFENIAIVGDSAWTSQDTVGLRLNGALTNIVLNGVDVRYARFDLGGGFATNGVVFNSCSATDCRSDGLRWFSGSGTYLWQNILILGGEYSRNGLALGANGAGISFFIQSGHTGTSVNNLVIQNTTVKDNYRAGISANDGAVAWATLIAAGNTTPPAKRFSGVVVKHNTVQNNGGAGITVLGAQPSTSFPVEIAYNTVEDNGANTTLGNIWTGGCLRPLIEHNVCRRAKTNGTVIGDGQGVFDDQWNDGAIVRYNLIEDNVYNAAVNPEYSAYGIGIYRCSNSKHYSNVIKNCRHGFVIGYVASATAPVMENIVVTNNTIINTDRFAISIWSDTPSDSLSIKNNLFLQGLQDIEAQSAGAGTQTYTKNAAILYTTKYTGNNVGASAVDHTSYTTQEVTVEGIPKVTSTLFTTGTDEYIRDFRLLQTKNTIGAFGASTILGI
jgi:hypothetical protein